MGWSKLALFFSGLFFGGAIDHVILAAMGSPQTPYGIRVGVLGNWAFAGFDLLVTAGLYLAHRRLELRSGLTSRSSGP